MLGMVSYSECRKHYGYPTFVDDDEDRGEKIQKKAVEESKVDKERQFKI